MYTANLMYIVFTYNSNNYKYLVHVIINGFIWFQFNALFICLSVCLHIDGGLQLRSSTCARSVGHHTCNGCRHFPVSELYKLSMIDIHDY